MSVSDQGSELEQLRRERDLYLRLLDLGHQREPEPFLAEALALMVELTGASQGYLELHDDDHRPEAPRWSLAHGIAADQVSSVRDALSRGIIAEAVASGQTIITRSAQEDPRFSERASVRMGRIEAVLCAPIGRDRPRGVLYLRGGPGGRFSEEDRARVELLARHLAPLAEGVVLQQRADTGGADPTAPWRERLRADAVIGRGAAMAAVLKQAALVAPLDVEVLLTGDSGTGKSQLARVIHDSGPRAGGPFIELNCAALPEHLIENELFGSAAGGHSAAMKPVQGKIEAAEGGTLFLDEIAEMALPVQAKLLQFLQNKMYYALGNPKPVQADVRIITATNVDLPRAVADKRFREDLLYRLKVVPIRVPSLAERPEDLAALAAHCCEQVCERHRLPRLQLSPNAARAVQAAEWPGNVRQLANAIAAAAIQAAGDGLLRIEPEHLFPDAPTAPTATTTGATFQQATRQFQEALLRRTLTDTEWNVSEAARRLDLTRTHVYNLIGAFELKRGT